MRLPILCSVAGWLACGLALGIGEVQPPLADSAVLGVVIEDVEEVSVFAEAGLKPGDVIVEWRRLASAPGGGAVAQGTIESAFDYMWLAVEEAPRGVIELTVRRDSEIRFFRVLPGAWKAAFRQRLPDPRLEAWMRGELSLGAAEAEALWMELATSASDKRLRCWMLMTAGIMHEDFEKQRAAYRSALEEAPEPFPESVVWRALGRSHERQGDLAAAADAFTKALEIRERAFGTSLAVAESLLDLGLLGMARREIAEAEAAFERALEIRRRLAPRDPAIGVNLYNLGILARHRGDFERASELLEQAQRVDLSNGASELVAAETLAALGSTQAGMGNLEAGAELHRRALAIKERQAPGSSTLAQSLNSLGITALRGGRLQEAEGLLRRALAIWEVQQLGTLNLAACLHNLGFLAGERGDLVVARDYLQRALEIKAEIAPGSLDLASTLNSLGTLAASRGELTRASSLLTQAHEIHRRLTPGSLLFAATQANLGSVELVLGNLILAQNLLLQAQDLYQTLAPEDPYLATIQGHLGSLALVRRDLAQAQELHTLALAAKRRQTARSIPVAESLSGLAMIAQIRGDESTAEGLYREARDICKDLAPDSIHAANASFTLGLLYYQGRSPRLERASQLFDEALANLEGQLARFGGAHDSRGGFRSHFDFYYLYALRAHLDLGRPAEAFHVLERLRARSFLEQWTERGAMSTAELPAELAHKRRLLGAKIDQALGQRMADPGESIANQRHERLELALGRLRHEARELEEEIRLASPRLASIHYPAPLDLAGASGVLDAGTFALSYSVGQDSTVVFGFSRDGELVVETIPIGSDAFREQVAAFGRDVRRGSRRGSQLDERLARQARSLFAALIAPFSSGIEASERLLILADGPLHTLPWAALFRELAGERQYLVEWKPLHLALSATVYGQQRALRRSGARSYSTQLVAFGAPSYPASGDHGLPRPDDDPSEAERSLFDWQPLPHTRQEVEGIAGLFPPEQVRLYQGGEASEANARALSRDVRLIHFAVHGHVDDQWPANSALALAMPAEVLPGMDNGLLQAREIVADLRLDADLVVLSACETALGEEQGGEGLVSLTRAFQLAGARSVAASLWKVADQATAELMTHFYRELTAGASKAEALRAAQLRFIYGEDERQRAPYFWAGFQIYGDWQ